MKPYSASTIRYGLIWLALCCTVGAAAPAAFGDPPSLQFGLDTGWNVATQKWAPIDNMPLLGGTLSLKTNYFLTPVLNVHHAWLASGKGTSDVGPPQGEVPVDSSLRALAFLAGPAVDLGPVRLTAAVGLYWLMVQSTVDGITIDPSTIVLGYAITVDGWFARWGWGQVGGFAMANFLAEAQIAYFGAGITTRFNLEL